MWDFALVESKWRTETALPLTTKIFIFLWKALFGQAWFSLHKIVLATHSHLLVLHKFGRAPSPSQGPSCLTVCTSLNPPSCCSWIEVTFVFCQSLVNSPSCPDYHGKTSLRMSSNSFSAISSHGLMYVQFKCYLTCFPSIQGPALSGLFICSQSLRFPKATSTSKYTFSYLVHLMLLVCFLSVFKFSQKLLVHACRLPITFLPRFLQVGLDQSWAWRSLQYEPVLHHSFLQDCIAWEFFQANPWYWN